MSMRGIFTSRRRVKMQRRLHFHLSSAHEIPRPLVQKLAILHAKECNLFQHELRSCDITRSRRDVQRCVAALCSTAVSPDAVRPLPLHCGRSPHRPLRPLNVGIRLCSEYDPQRSALMGHHTPDIQFFACALRPCRKIRSGHVHW